MATPRPRRTPKRATPPPEVEPDPLPVRGFVESHWPFFRDVALFVGGLLGVAHETLGRQTERPTLLVFFALMMGLPMVFPKGQDK